MSIVEHLYPPILRRQSPDASINPADNHKEAKAWHAGAARSSFFWGMQLLSVRRRRAMYALVAFCREVNDIAGGAASCLLKENLLLNWRSEIAHLYAGRPRRAVTRGLNQAVQLCGLRCDDFLAIIDGAEMDARAERRAWRSSTAIANARELR